LAAASAEVDDAKLSSFMSEIEGKDVAALIAEGNEKLAVVVAAAAAVAAAVATAVARRRRKKSSKRKRKTWALISSIKKRTGDAALKTDVRTKRFPSLDFISSVGSRNVWLY
jgi:hypothetical protein